MADNEAKISIVADASGVAPGAQEAVKQVQAIAPATKEAAKGFGDIKASADDAFRAVASTAEASSKGVAAALDRQAVSAAQTKFAMRDLSYQISDVSTSLSSGISPMVVFAQQGSQIVGAISLMKGESSAFVNFLAGPWGAAIMGAIGLIGILASKHQEAAKAEGDQKEKAKDLTGAIKDLDEITGRAKKSTEELAQAAINSAVAFYNKTVKIRETTKALLEQAIAEKQIQGIRAQAPGQRGELGALGQESATRWVDALQLKLKQVQDQMTNAQQGLNFAKGFQIRQRVDDQFDGAAAATHRFERAVTDLNKRLETGKILPATYTAEYTKLKKREADELASAAKSKSGNTAELDATARLATADTAAERARASLTLTRIKAREELKAGTISATEYLAKVSAAEGAVQEATTKKPKKAPSRVGDWEVSLEEQKLALSEWADQQSNLRGMSLREEANYWDSIKRRSDLSHEERTAVEKRYYAATGQMRQEEFDTYISELNTKLQEARGNAAEQIRIANQIVTATSKAYGEDSKQYEQALQKKLQVDRQVAAERIRLAEQTTQAILRRQDLALQGRIDASRFLTDLGVQTPYQETKQAIDAEKMSGGWKLVTLNQNILKTQGDDDAQRRAIEQKAQFELQLQNRLTAYTRQGVLQRTAIERQALGNIAQSWGQNIARLVTLQQGFGTTFRGMYMGLVSSAEQAISQMVAQWLLGMLTKAAVSKSFHAKQVLLDAKQAAAGAWNSTVHIPIVGPILAPIAAATAFAGVMSFSAKDGYDVPDGVGPGIDGRGGQVGILHPREMVLPAGLATPLRDMVTGGGAPSSTAQQGQPSVNHHYHGPVIMGDLRAIDTQSGAQFLRKNSRHIAAAADSAIRGGFSPKGGK